jgi:DNA (cytosine-5)-methyltransferase 1
MDFESETFVASFAPAISASNPYGDNGSREALLVTHALRADGFDASEDGTGRGTPLVPVAQVLFDTTQIKSAGNYSNPQLGDACHPLSAGAHPPAIAGAGVRRLTPRECERLQGVPDNFTVIPWRGGMAPDGPRYKALGNSMAVPCMAWIGRRIAVEDAQ